MKEYIVKHIYSNLQNAEGSEMSPLWEKANVICDFSYPWEDKEAPTTRFRALWDDNYFYFRYDVEDENVLTYIDKDHKMEVVDSDRVEIFIRKDEKLNPYYCLEMDARARVLDYTTKFYRDYDYLWEWPKPDNLRVKAFENKTGYIVEGAISLSSLKDLGLFKNNELEIGLFRGHCMELPVGDADADLRWISWVKPDSDEPDFHIPSSFGIFKFVK